MCKVEYGQQRSDHTCSHQYRDDRCEDTGDNFEYTVHTFFLFFRFSFTAKVSEFLYFFENVDDIRPDTDLVLTVLNDDIDDTFQRFDLTSQGRTPRRFSSFTSFGHPSPAHSSVHEEDRYTSCGGTKPASNSSSTAWKKAISEHLVSDAPRPQTLPSAMSPENGPCSHSPSAGTTSWWLISTMGLSDDRPFQ